MMGQCRKMRREIGGMQLLQRLTDGSMKPRALRVGRALIERLAEKRVVKR